MTDRTRHTQSCELENSGAAAMHVGCRSIDCKTDSTWPFRSMVVTALSSKLRYEGAYLKSMMDRPTLLINGRGTAFSASVCLIA
jgi:hypothetical protein